MNKGLTIYKSSAGSGKTYNLVKEYITLVLNNPECYKNILAVTFTNKAAEEMKRRIIDKLKSLASGDDKNYETELRENGVDGAVAAKASFVLDLILHNYSYFSICTIDSFFNRIIRAFARELKLQFGYSIEIQSDEPMQKVVDDLLNETGIDASLTRYLQHYVLHNIGDNKDWKIEKHISDLSKQILNEKYWELQFEGKDILYDRKKILRIVEEMKQIIDSFEDKMTEFGEEAEKIFAQTGTRVEDFYQTNKGPAGYLKNLKTKRDYIPNNYVLSSLTSKNVLSSSCRNRKLAQEVFDTRLSPLLKKALAHYDKDYIRFCTAFEVKKNIFINGILNDLAEKLKQYRDEHNIILIEDLSFIIRSIVKNNPSPFIYEKAAYCFKHFLIDEFQDTSSFQWKNLLPLITDSLGERNFSMVVGDSKQSIYRWRGSDPRLLASFLDKDLPQFKPVSDTIILSENRRSREVLVDFFNGIFKDILSFVVAELRTRHKIPDRLLDEIGKVYNDISQTSKAGAGGYVNIKFFPRDVQDYTDKSRALTAQYVREAIEDGYLLKDITILTRKKDEASRLAVYLMKDGFRVLSDDSLLLTGSPAVKILLNALKILVDNSNSMAKVELMYDYLVHVKNNPPQTDGVVKIFSAHSDNQIFSSVFPHGIFSVKDGRLSVNKEIETLNLYRLVERLVELFQLDDLDSYILRFKDVVLEYSRANTSDINSFLQWWENHKEEISIAIPEDQDAIRIMTIHKAKGLQNRIVIIPFLNWTLNPQGNDLLWVETAESPFGSSPYLVKGTKKLANTYFKDYLDNELVLTNIDNMNLIYVAFTRAADRLYAIGSFATTGIRVIPAMLQEIFLGSPMWSKYFNTAKLLFEAGTRSKKEKAEESDGKVVRPILKLKDPSAFGKLVYRQTHENVDAEQYAEFLLKKQYGILVHKVLSEINSYDDIGIALDNLVKRGYLTNDAAARLKIKLDEIFALPGVSELFQERGSPLEGGSGGVWQVHSEKDILTPDGSILRPDRVITKENEAVVVDFKTGKFSEKFRDQMAAYESALKKMGYPTVTKYILSIQENKLYKL